MTPAQLVALDALREAFDEATVARMVAAIQGRYVEAEETWGDESYLAHLEDVRPQLIANTRIRLATAIGRQLLADGFFAETTSRGPAQTTYRLRLLVSASSRPT